MASRPPAGRSTGTEAGTGTGAERGQALGRSQKLSVYSDKVKAKTQEHDLQEGASGAADVRQIRQNL